MEPKQTVDKVLDPIELTILSGETTSDAAVIYGTTIMSVVMPGAITGTSLSFEGSIDDGATYQPIYNSSGQISYTVAAGNAYTLTANDFVAFDRIKLVMASQGADRTIKIKPVLI